MKIKQKLKQQPINSVHFISFQYDAYGQMISLTHTLALSSVTGQKNKWKFNAKCEKEEKKNNDDNNNIGKNLKTKKISFERERRFFL